MMRWWMMLLALLLLPSCKGAGEGDKAQGGGATRLEATGPITINGAGATFPYPLYSRWVADYERVDARVRINYQSIGSGGGIRQLLEGTVDFGASDVAMTDEQLAKAKGAIVHIPATLGAVVLAYNVEGVRDLKLAPEAIAGVFLGEIKRWNDPRLAASNPGVALPDKEIAVIHRSDGSGTTAVFTEYLARVSPAWKERVGVGTSVSWPSGLAAKGNEGVTGQIKMTPSSLGYIEQAYAVQNKLPIASVANRAGAFVQPTLEAVTAAADAAAERLPADLRVSIVDPPGERGYPIASYSFLLVPEELPPGAKGRALAGFLWWALHEGQRVAPTLGYAPLPAKTIARAEEKVKSLRSGGAPALAAP